MRILKLLLAGVLVWIGLQFFFGAAFKLFTLALQLALLGAIALTVLWLVRGRGRSRELRRAGRVLRTSAHHALPSRRRGRIR